MSWQKETIIPVWSIFCVPEPQHCISKHATNMHLTSCGIKVYCFLFMLFKFQITPAILVCIRGVANLVTPSPNRTALTEKQGKFETERQRKKERERERQRESAFLAWPFFIRQQRKGIADAWPNFFNRKIKTKTRSCLFLLAALELLFCSLDHPFFKRIEVFITARSQTDLHLQTFTRWFSGLKLAFCGISFPDAFLDRHPRRFCVKWPRLPGVWPSSLFLHFQLLSNMP